MRRINLFVISLLVAAPAAAEIYQWRDARGQVHYSDAPAAGADAKPMRAASRPPTPRTTVGEVAGDAEDANAAGKTAPGNGNASAEPAKPKTLAAKEVEFRQRRAEAAEASAKAETERQRAAARERDCGQARNQLAALESGQRMARFNSDGEREVLDDAARAEEAARARTYVESACK